MEEDCHKPKILRLVDDVVVSSSIEIRSEEMSLIGSNSRFLSQRDIEPSSTASLWSRNQASQKTEQKPTPKVKNDGHSASRFMFDVLNSTFSVSGVHAILTSERCGLCSVVGSTVRFSSSSITSAGDSSPFVIRISEKGGMTFESTIVLSSVTHQSESNNLPPFVCLGDPHASLTSSTSPQLSDLSVTNSDAITIVGTELSLESKHLIGGTAPLFSFGLTEQSSSLAASGYDMQIETSLLESSLVNVSSSSPFTPTKQLFGSEVVQLVVGCSVVGSTNHDSGTGMMSANLGGTLGCLNTSFSWCIRQSNAVKDFQNKNYTQGSRLNNVTSDVTSVTFTLCTFSEMTVAAGVSKGGGAIFLWHTLSSLTVRTCFFHKCTCTADNDDGGAINFRCNDSKRRPFTLSLSSFTECVAKDCGGSLFVHEASSISIDRSFFELSAALRFGSVYVDSSVITISNCTFVECFAYETSGALFILDVVTLSLSFSQFRESSSFYDPNGKDVYFYENRSAQIASDMFSFCDSTSGAPNVYFQPDSHSDSKHIPQISQRHSVVSVDVLFVEGEATVTVETDEAIKGTMGVLLDGSNVPRLVHVVFGDPSKESRFGTAVVSSGAKGILPNADYSHRKSSITSNSFPPPTVHSAESALKDWNTTEIVVNGVQLEEGSYWMLVEKEKMKWNITLTRTDSTTLNGTAPLHPSTAEDRLEWATEYEITKVMWLPKDGQTAKDVTLSKRIAFTTPGEPPRIEGADCSLDEDKQKSALVTLTGVKLGEGKNFNLTVQKMVGSTPSGDDIVLYGTFSGNSFSTEHTHSVEIFGISNPPLLFQTTYLITKFDVDGSISAVDTDVTFFVPAEPARLTFLDASLQYSTDEKNATISLSGIGMKGDYNVTLSVNSSSTDNVTLKVTFDADGNGVVPAVLFDSSDPPIVDLSYNTRYEVVDVAKESTPIWFENDLVFTTIPAPSRLLSINLGECAIGMDFVELSFDSIALPSEKTFTLTLESVHYDATTPHQKVIIHETDGSGKLKRHRAQLYPFETEAEKKKGQLEYGTEYKVVSIAKGSTSVHFEDDRTRIHTPMEPARIEKCTHRTLNSDRTELELSLEGRKLRANLGFLNLTTDPGSWTSIGGIEADDETHCSVRFLTAESEDSTHVEFGKEYTLKTVSADESTFVVNNGITIVVPLPPKIIKMEFSFSNSLHTGCFLTLIGTDLIVGNSLKITLNNSLSFIATVISPTEARSLELQIGWPSTLQHNTKYTIISIEAMNKDDGETLFDSAVSDTTGSHVHPFVISVDSDVSSESSLFCGDVDRPCSSIEDGWKIVNGVEIASFSISIICNTTQTEQVRILSHHRVVIESGPSTKPELFVSPSSELEGEGMVDVSGGRLWIHQVDVVLSDSPLLIFIRMVGGHLTIETCSLVGPKGTPISNIDSTADLCEWETSVINLVNSTTTITSTQMTRLPQGAINMKGGNLTIQGSIFANNAPHSSTFPSLRHNIRCSEGGEIEIGSLNGGDGKTDHPHLWLSHQDCVLSGDDVNTNAQFFIPTLSSSSTSKLNTKKTGFEVTIEGTTLIPCSLFLEVFEKKKDGNEGQKVQIPLSEDSTESFNETNIKMSLHLSSMSEFNKGLEWRGRLIFGLNETTASFVIQKDAAERRSQAVIENMKWWIPLLVSLVCLLVLIIVVVFICWCQRKRNIQKQGKGTILKQLEEEDEAARLEMEQKMEETIPDKSVDSLICVKETQLPTHNSDPTSTLAPIQSHFVEVLGESGEVGVFNWTKADTLFDVLHQPEKKRVIDKKELGRKIVKGLIRILGDHPTSEISTRFSPHWVLVNKNMVQLRLATIPEGQQEGEQEIPNDTQHKKEGELADSFFGGRLSAVKSRTVEGQRWRAPELCRPLGEKIDVESALVFSLGLVLWEVWTGEVPWKEMDEANAGRQNEGGVQPNLKLVVDAEIRELITKCLSFDPKDRPSLKEVLSGLGGTESVAPERAAILPKASDPLDIHS
ncbi:hypothetical protein BLNAU_9663 [Blattamonas nauphoetae]|uniref:Protein kinase domain-containing protein n=1 Tax=Blattamonas nauphoetae TaxID=2049346 RepID=A0ABQ9XVD7_9EUKA|nr:hypothetical protein BLNAU_9663 [Blattamonas nauphoetae]